MGRGDDLAAVIRAFGRAVGAPGVELVTIVAEPGMGKSRLVREAIIAATTQLPAPSGRIYRAAGRHIRAVGRFFELAPAREVRS
jgi:hypothetical protein